MSPRQILIDCWPYLAAIVVSVVIMRLLIAFSGARIRVSQLKKLHGDESGGVQSLAFVLTIPVFTMFLMFIVQMSQLVIAQVVIHYSAFAAARSAIVWIPAYSGQEYANEIGNGKSLVSSEGSLDVYEISEGTEKYERIRRAAAMACMSICPSRDIGASSGGSSSDALTSIQNAYLMAAPSQESNGQIETRLSNKLNYALGNTQVTIQVRHKTDWPDVAFDNPSLWTLTKIPAQGPPPNPPGFGRDYWQEFTENEIGWHDQVEVRVEHNFAMLPGPGGLIALLPRAEGGGQGTLRQGYLKIGDAYAVPITATVRLQNEGQKALLPYYQFGAGP